MTTQARLAPLKRLLRERNGPILIVVLLAGTFLSPRVARAGYPLVAYVVPLVVTVLGGYGLVAELRDWETGLTTPFEITVTFTVQTLVATLVVPVGAFAVVTAVVVMGWPPVLLVASVPLGILLLWRLLNVRWRVSADDETNPTDGRETELK